MFFGRGCGGLDGGDVGAGVVGDGWGWIVVAEEVGEGFFFALRRLGGRVAVFVVVRVESVWIANSALRTCWTTIVATGRLADVILDRWSDAVRVVEESCSGIGRRLGHLRGSKAILSAGHGAARVDSFSHPAICKTIRSRLHPLARRSPFHLRPSRSRAKEVCKIGSGIIVRDCSLTCLQLRCSPLWQHLRLRSTDGTFRGSLRARFCDLLRRRPRRRRADRSSSVRCHAPWHSFRCCIRTSRANEVCKITQRIILRDWLSGSSRRAHNARNFDWSILLSFTRISRRCRRSLSHCCLADPVRRIGA